MRPLLQEARRKGVRIADYEAIVHETTDPELVIAEFTLSIEVGQNASRMDFVQVMRVRGDYIVAVREYFSPSARSEAVHGRAK